MIYFCAVFMGILVGLILKGKLSNLLNFRLNKTWVLIAAFVIQSSSQVLAVRGFSFAVHYSMGISILVFVMLFTVLWLNRKYIGVLVIGAGCFLNSAVMLANGGKMPVSEALLVKEKLYSVIEIYRIGGDGKHILAGEATRLSSLGDMISMPDFFGNIAKFVSIGDLFVVFGLFVLVAEAVSGAKLEKADEAA